MVGATHQWWRCNHGLHRDVNARFQDLYLDLWASVVHGFRPQQRHELHLYGPCIERQWKFNAIIAVFSSDTSDHFWRTNSGDGREGK